MIKYTRMAFYISGALGCLAPSIALAACTGPGAPTTTETRCMTAIEIPGNPLRSYDISWVDSKRGEYYLGDRSNSGIDVIDTKTLKFKRTIGGFVGAKLRANGNVDNQHSGPDGVVSHGRWLYAGDGDSTLKVIDLDSSPPIKASISTGGTTRLDELDVTSDGKFILAANNAENPPFATLFTGNGDSAINSVKIITRITIKASVLPAGAELALEQPAWDPVTKRFYTSIPIIAENPPGCNFKAEKDKVVTCDGGVLVTDPAAPDNSPGLYDPKTRSGVIALHGCGPNGATTGPHGNIMLGCTTANNPANRATLVLNGVTGNYVHVAGIYGSDQVWYDKGAQRYYTGSNRMKPGAVMGVIGADNILIESLPISSGSHSVAVDSARGLIFVPQSAPASVVGAGGDTTDIGEGICGGKKGCIAVYRRGK